MASFAIKKFVGWLIGLTLTAAIGYGLWVNRSAPSQTREAVTIGIAETLSCLPVFVAAENGFFRDEGLDATYKSFPSGKAALEALMKGEVDVAMAAETPLVLQSFRSSNFRVITNFTNSYANIKIVARSDRDIRSTADLRGKRVAVLKGTSAQFYLEAMLKDQGLMPSDIVEVAATGQNIVPLIVDGQVDAMTGFEPYPALSRAQLPDQHLVLDVGNKRVRETVSYVVSEQFATRRALTSQRVLRATARAIEWVDKNRDQAILLAARRLKMTAPVVAGLWDDYIFALGLDQTFLLSLEAQARWAVKVGLVGQDGNTDTLPNFLGILDPAPLSEVAPRAAIYQDARKAPSFRAEM